MTFNQLVDAMNGYKQELYSLGKDLAYAKEHYNEMIGGDLTWTQFVEQPEIGLTVREANALIKLSEWIDGTGVALADINLATARFAASRGIYDPSLDEDMKVLSVRDFKERHWEVAHPKEDQTFTYMVMKRSDQTGSLSKVYEEELEDALKNIQNG